MGTAVSFGLLLLASTLLTTVPRVDGDRASSQCVQLGQSVAGAQSNMKYNPTHSIGAENFTTVNIQSLGFFAQTFNKPKGRARGKKKLDRICADGGYGEIDVNTIYCPQNVEIRTNLVRQNGIVLRGWLYVEIELTDKADSMEFIYVQFRDEHFSAIGEFVTEEAEQCKPDEKGLGLVQPTPYQVYPCGAIGFREARASSALFVAKHSQYVNSFVKDPSNGIQYITKEDLTRGIYFTWRMSEFWCSRHERFRIDANIVTEKARHRQHQVDRIWRKDLAIKVTDFWLHPAWYGAADIKVGDKQLDCNLSAINYTTGEVSKEAAESWIQPNATRLTFGNDITNPAFRDDAASQLASCVQRPHDFASKNFRSQSKSSTIPTFGGRCFNNSKDQPDIRPSRNFVQGCSNDPSSPEHRGLNFTTYTDYAKTITQGRLRQCEQVCVHPDKHNETHLKDIQSFPKSNRPVEKQRVSLTTLRESRAHSRNATFWQTRKYHGNLCVFVTMFLIPFSNFLARYYKETFMENYHTIPSWLWFHGSVGYVSLTLFRSSYTAMSDHINNWGRSTSDAAKFHRSFGYTFISIFAVMSFLGGIRTLDARVRMILMIAHAVTGFGLYFMAYALVIFAKDIPGSPSATCNQQTGLPEGSSETAIYASVWLGMDILFHIMMTTSQMLLDRKERIRRPGKMGIIFVPMLQPHHRRNYPGTTFRKVVLIAYATLSVTLTFLTIGRMFVNDDYENCTLGEMSCNDTEHPFGCSPISMKYLELVIKERYNVTSVHDLE